MVKFELTQEVLKHHLHYDPLTGIFTWLNPLGSVIKPGAIAGYTVTKGYKQLELRGVAYRLHRLAWFYVCGKWPENQIDHINGIPYDNRLSNLREATNGENKRNALVYKNNDLGEKHIHFIVATKKYRVRCYRNKKFIHVGYFNSLEEAKKARDFYSPLIDGNFYKED